MRLAVLLILTVHATYASAENSSPALVRAVAAKEHALDNSEPANWLETYDRFLEVDAIENSPPIKYELGFAAMRLGYDDMAYGYYEDAIALGLSGPALDDAQKFLASRAPMMAYLAIDGPDGVVVQIRGMDRGRLPLRKVIAVLPGETELVIRERSGGTIRRRHLALSPKRVTILDLREEPRSAQDRSHNQSRLEIGAEQHIRHEQVKTLSPTHRSRQTSHDFMRPLVGVGLGLAVTGAIAVPMSMLILESKRKQLSRSCDEPMDNPDGCIAVKQGQYETALDLADGIAHWRTVRAAGWAGIGAGVSLVAFGWLLKKDEPRLSLSVVTTARSLGMQCSWRF